MKPDFLGNEDDVDDPDYMGNSPDVKEGGKLEAERVITSASQAFDICERLVQDWDKGVANSAQITAKLNGDRPYNSRTLKNQGKAWKTNISTGFLSTECGILPLPNFRLAGPTELKRPSISARK